MAVGTTTYLVSFAHIVANEQDLAVTLGAQMSGASDVVKDVKGEKTTLSNNQEKKTMHATFTTNQGAFEVELYGDTAPKTVENFTKLAQSGFYDGTRFHRVIKGFMIQGGDPLSKDPAMQAQWGTGGPGYTIPDEADPNSELYKTGYQRGIFAMARTMAPNSGGSQFFVMHADYPLPPSYTIFGRVTSGMETVDKIATAPTGPNDRPLQDMIIEKVVVK